MYDVETEEEVYVVTYKELIFTLIVFTVILVALYPKAILKDQISNDQSNYELNMLYLNDLLKHSPDDESLKLIMLEQNVHVGYIDKSVKLGDELIKSNNSYIRNQAMLLSYQAKKAKYFSTKDKSEKKQFYKDLKYLFGFIYAEELYDEPLEPWYEEAVFVQNTPAAYYLLNEVLKDHPDNIQLLQNGYYLTFTLKKPQDRYKFINALERYDTNNTEKWAIEEYIYFIQNKEYKRAQTVLNKYASDSVKIEERLAEFYLMQQNYTGASSTYMELYYQVKSKTQQKKYLRKAIRALQGGNLLEDAAQLVRQNETKYIADKQMRKFFLKIYLAAGKLEYASQLSKKILKYENKL